MHFSYSVSDAFMFKHIGVLKPYLNCFADKMFYLFFRDVCNRRRDLQNKGSSTIHSPQGPLWKRFTLTQSSPEKWIDILSPVTWKTCGVCRANPLDVWTKSGAWDLFHRAKTIMMRIEQDSQKKVILDTVRHSLIP